jgi:hypothetical protein
MFYLMVRLASTSKRLPRSLYVTGIDLERNRGAWAGGEPNPIMGVLGSH